MIYTIKYAKSIYLQERDAEGSIYEKFVDTRSEKAALTSSDVPSFS